MYMQHVLFRVTTKKQMQQTQQHTASKPKSQHNNFTKLWHQTNCKDLNVINNPVTWQNTFPAEAHTGTNKTQQDWTIFPLSRGWMAYKWQLPHPQNFSLSKTNFV